MTELILTTFDRPPDLPSNVRDLRVRWALEEAGLAYRVVSGLRAYPACRNYVARATARPPIMKAYRDQLARFAAED